MKYLKSKLSLIIFVVLYGLNSFGQIDSIEYYLEKGGYYIKNHNYQEALNVYKKASDLDSTISNHSIYYNLSILEKLFGNYQESLNYMKITFDILDKKDINHKALLRIRADIYYHLENYDKALIDIEEYFHFHTGDYNMDDYNVAGLIYICNGKFKKGIEYIETAISMGVEDDVDTYFRLASSCAEIGKYHLALKYYLYLKSFEPQFLVADYGVGEAYLNLQNYEKAKEYLLYFYENYTFDKNSDYDLYLIMKVHFYLGVCYYYLEQYEKSLEFLVDKAHKEMFASHAFAPNEYIGMNYLKMGKLDRAREFLIKAIDKSNENKVGRGLGYIHLGRLEIQEDNPTKAEEYLFKGLQITLETGDLQSFIKLHETYLELGDKEKALKMYDIAIEFYPRIFDLYKLKINFLLQNSENIFDIENLIGSIDELIEISKPNLQIQAHLNAYKALIYAETKDYEKSLTLIKTSTSQDPISDYYAIRSYILYKEAQSVNKQLTESGVDDSGITTKKQEEILSMLEVAMSYKHRLKELYYLKATFMKGFGRAGEACEAINKSVELGSKFEKELINYFCSDVPVKENEWEFYIYTPTKLELDFVDGFK